METIEEKVEKAVVKIAADEKYLTKLNLLQQFTSIYPFTTENIKGYLGQYDFTNQTILTVGGSGDHILNLILLGATEIDYFDINPFTEFYVELKLAAVKALEWEEFISYFACSDYCDLNQFSIRLYHKISPYLNNHVRNFWDFLYLEFTGNTIRTSDLFEWDDSPSEVLPDINPYLEKENYNKLKEKLLHNQYRIQFYEENLKDLPSKLEKQYHAILLSNIGGYLHKIFDFSDFVNSEEITEDDFYLSKFQQLIEKIVFHLDIDGIIFVMYLFNQRKSDVYSDSRFSIYKKRYREKYFPIETYPLFYFKGMTQIQHEIDQEDAVLIYKKNR